MEYSKTINVNELNDILKKHFRTRSVFITKIEYGSLFEQHKPKTHIIGIGGRLGITFDTSRKLK